MPTADFPFNPLSFDRRNLSDDDIRSLYKQLMLPRMIEEKMLSQLRQGKISKWFSGMGQEAISVGAAAALDATSSSCPCTETGHFHHTRHPVGTVVFSISGKSQWLHERPRRSFHFGSIEHRIVGMISHLGPQLGIADGIALAHKLDASEKATLVFTGDGGASEGISTKPSTLPLSGSCRSSLASRTTLGAIHSFNEQFRCEHFTDKAMGYGIPEEDAIQVDGNDILAVFHAVRDAAESIRKRPRPILLEFKTFRMRGHEEASGTKYYPEGLIDHWGQIDPVERFTEWAKAQGALDDDFMASVQDAHSALIKEGLKAAAAEPRSTPRFRKNSRTDLHQRLRRNGLTALNFLLNPNGNCA